MQSPNASFVFSLNGSFDTFQVFYPVGKNPEEIEIKSGDVLVSVAVPLFKTDQSDNSTNHSVSQVGSL